MKSESQTAASPECSGGMFGGGAAGSKVCGMYCAGSLVICTASPAISATRTNPARCGTHTGTHKLLRKVKESDPREKCSWHYFGRTKRVLRLFVNPICCERQWSSAPRLTRGQIKAVSCRRPQREFDRQVGSWVPHPQVSEGAVFPLDTALDPQHRLAPSTGAPATRPVRSQLELEERRPCDRIKAIRFGGLEAQ